MTLPGIAALVTLLLVGCQSADPFCRAHNAADVAPTREAFRAMSPRERQEATRRFDEAALRCRWEP